MVVDYDFVVGKKRFRGVGWRGLAALAVMFVLRATVFGIILVSAKPSGAWLVQLLQRLLGI